MSPRNTFLDLVERVIYGVGFERRPPGTVIICQSDETRAALRELKSDDVRDVRIGPLHVCNRPRR